jgi:hypothetical protein
MKRKQNNGNEQDSCNKLAGKKGIYTFLLHKVLTLSKLVKQS